MLHVGCVAHYKVGDRVSLKFGPHDNICTPKATCFPSHIATLPLPPPLSPCSQHPFLCPFHIQIQTHLTANLTTANAWIADTTSCMPPQGRRTGSKHPLCSTAPEMLYHVYESLRTPFVRSLSVFYLRTPPLP